MLTTVPFSGFYESLHDSELDQALERLFQDENGNENAALSARFSALVDWRKAQTFYAMAYVENFALRFSVVVKWESMRSPKFYNFETDRLFAHIEYSEVERIRGLVDPGRLVRLIEARFTSRSGFISHYSNNIEDWGPMDGWDHNQIGTLVQAYADQESNGGEFGAWDEHALMEDENCNGNIDEWLFKAAKHGEKLDRIEKVHAYLRARQERARR